MQENYFSLKVVIGTLLSQTGTMVDYAKKRIKDHVGRFTKLYNDIKSNTIDENYLKDISEKDSIFPDIDYKIYI